MISQNTGGIPIAPGLDEETTTPPASGLRMKRRFLFVCATAVVIAAFTSLIARLLIYLINLFTNISFYGKFSAADVSPAGNALGWWVILVPVGGGILIGLMAYYGSKAIRGHGIPEAMEQILTNQSKISPAITYLKPLSSAISIGTGGPFGAEGPIIATGGALGSTIGQVLKISHYERKILLTAGAAAGMSAIFNSPVAAIFLAIELLLFEFSPRSIIPVALAAITGAAGHHLLFNADNAFPAPPISPPGTEALVLYSLMGLLLGLVAAVITKSVYFIEDSFEKLPVHWMWWPAIGGLAVGVIGKIAPRTLGVGYENIADIVSASLPLKVILFLCIMKFISWAIALGSGTSGGTLAPLLTIGGATGILLGKLAAFAFPQAHISLTVAAMVGMSATFAGASRALLTSIVFALETTGQLNALLPLLSSCTASYLVSFFMMENTIMTEKIARRGVKAPQSYEPDLLEKLTVNEVMRAGGLTINGSNSIKEMRSWLNNHQSALSSHFIIVNNSGEYTGVISFHELYGTGGDENATVQSLIRNGTTAVTRYSNLRAVVEIMARDNVDLLPVKESDTSNIVIAVLSYRDVISAYGHRVAEHGEAKHHISLKHRGIRMLVKGQKLIRFERG